MILPKKKQKSERFWGQREVKKVAPGRQDSLNMCENTENKKDALRTKINASREKDAMSRD